MAPPSPLFPNIDVVLYSDVALVWTQILISLGGAFSVVGSRVATQASVPHQDMATVIALLALWTKIGGAIGSAISTAIWKSVKTICLTPRLRNLMVKFV